MYYRYDGQCIIVEKSNEVIEGGRVCQSEIDFDIDLNDIYVGNIKDGALTHYRIKAKEAETLTKNLRATNTKVAAHDDDIGALYDYVADSIYNDCLGDLGMAEEREVN